MEKRLIAGGLLSGALGGVLAFLFARIFAEPVIGRAIEFEDGRMEAARAQGVQEHGAELFSRGVQANAGLGFGVLAFAVAMGALFAVAFIVCYGRVGGLAPRTLSMRLAVAAFAVVYLVPFVKYPPNPPAVGQADTIGARTGWYLAMVALSVAAAMAAMWLARRLIPRLGGWIAGLMTTGAYLVTISVVMLLLPAVDETPGPMYGASGLIVYPGFPADELYHFRLYSLGTQLVLWTIIGLVFATLAGRLLDERTESRQATSMSA